MTASSQQQVRSLFIPIQEANLLLPGTVVAEIVPYAEPAPPQDAAPAWFLGSIVWREQRIPLISIDALISGMPAPADGRSRIAVLKALSTGQDMPYYAVVTRQIPRLAMIYDDSIEALDEGLADSPAVAAEVLASGEPALIPDADYIEQQVYAVLNP